MKLLQLGLLLIGAACIFSGLLFITLLAPWLLIAAIPVVILSLNVIPEGPDNEFMD